MIRTQGNKKKKFCDFRLNKKKIGEFGEKKRNFLNVETVLYTDKRKTRQFPTKSKTTEKNRHIHPISNCQTILEGRKKKKKIPTVTQIIKHMCFCSSFTHDVVMCSGKNGH